MQYLGQCISAGRNSVDPSKISALTNWPNVNKCVQLTVRFRIYRLVQFWRGIFNACSPTKLYGCWDGQMNLEKARRSVSRVYKGNDKCTCNGIRGFLCVLHFWSGCKPQWLGSLPVKRTGGECKAHCLCQMKLDASWKNYSCMKLEFVVMKWAMTKFSWVSVGQQCVIWTDNNLLSFLVTAKLGATEQWWVVELSAFNYAVNYCPKK